MKVSRITIAMIRADPALLAGLAVPAPVLGAFVLDGVRPGPDDGFLATRLVDPLRVTHAGHSGSSVELNTARGRTARRTSASIGQDGPVSNPREVTVLGWTGRSDGRRSRSLEQNPDRLRIAGLAAGGADVALLAEQALTLGVRTVTIARATWAQDLQLAFYAAASAARLVERECALPEILAGPRAAEELAARPADVVLNAITGRSAGTDALRRWTPDDPRTREQCALIAGGPRLRPPPNRPDRPRGLRTLGARSVPPRRGRADEVERLVAPASGGAFRGSGGTSSTSRRDRRSPIPPGPWDR